jgi:hypothetical protein
MQADAEEMLTFWDLPFLKEALGLPCCEEACLASWKLRSAWRRTEVLSSSQHYLPDR